MFNWYAVPTFAAMLLFWVLGAYVLTRSPRGAVSLTAAGAQISTACYLLGQGMAANAESPSDVLSWARSLQWGATIAPTLWYLLTTLLLWERPAPGAQRYVRLVAVPLGILFSLVSLALTAAIYTGDSLDGWSQIAPMAVGASPSTRYSTPSGPLYPVFVALLAGTTLAAAGNVALAWRLAVEEEHRRRFRWLFVGAMLFVIGANALGIVNYLAHGLVPMWIGHLILAAAMVAMAWNVAAYSLLIRGQVIRRDFFYFLTATTLMCALYAGFFLAFGHSYSLQLLGLAVMTLILVILTHAFTDLGRKVLDRLFFAEDVQQLRANLASTIQSAGMTDDLPTVLTEAQAEIAQVSADHVVRLTEHALRRLNNPAALAECELLGRIPEVVTAHGGADLTPLERARALREVLTAAIERLKPPDGDGIGAPAALQYHILREEYLQGLLNKQIMGRHSISEGTFHRNRRQAILTLARELENQEQRLTSP